MNARLSTPEDVARALHAMPAGEGSWKARCPGHDDRNPSLSIGTGKNGKVLLTCFAGCPFADLAEILERDHGLTLRGSKVTRKPRQRARKTSSFSFFSSSTREDPGMHILSSESPQPRPNGGNGADAKGFTPIIPAPEDPPSGHFGSSSLGAPVAVFRYCNAAGETEGFVRRFNMADGSKTFLPLRYGTLNGVARWHAKGWGADRPLYRLPQLLAAPGKPVLVTEGELKADVAAKLFPDFATVAPMNGAKSPGRTDWTPLQGRPVAVWPDNDEEGRKFAQAVAELATAAGAASVSIIAVPDSFRPKWDLADEPPPGTDLRAILNAAEPWNGNKAGRDGEAGTQAPSLDDLANYRMLEDGLYFCADPEKPPIRLCGRFEIIAKTRSHEGEGWGLLIEWRDDDGRPHRWEMPQRMLAGDPFHIRERLLDGGLFIDPGKFAKDRLAWFLAAVQVQERARCVAQVGWHGGQYVAPERLYGAGERVVLQSATPIQQPDVRGTLDGWQSEVAAKAEGNTRLAFALSAAFAGPLLDLVGEESHGFHLSGPSSIGKTTALRLAGSVWGCRHDSWRTTDNAAEATAASHNDGLLLLDELSQVDWRAAEAIAYMLANSAGKARMRRDGTLRTPLTWRIVFLSTGETGLAEKLGEYGRRAKAGHGVRMIEIPADAGRGQGLFETLHGARSGETFAKALQDAGERHTGRAIDLFLEAIARDAEQAARRVRELQREWLDAFPLTGADGQVSRVAAKFALVAAAGALACELAILPWTRNVAFKAVETCFLAWLDKRGTTGPSETEEGIAQVKLFIEQHGSSRFPSTEEIVRQNHNGTVESYVPEERTINRAGFRKSNDIGGWDYLVLPETWRNEVCKGYDARAIAKEMLRRGLIVPDDSRKSEPSRSERVPGPDKGRKTIKIRCYRVKGGIIEDVTDEDENDED